MNGVKIGKVRKLENSKIDEEEGCQNEKKFRNLNHKGFARRNREKHAIWLEK